MVDFRLNVVLILSLLVFGSCTKEESIQDRLDKGLTPFEIDQDDIGVSIDFLGFFYAGGIIIEYDSEDGTGLLASMEDIGKLPWGCAGIDINPDSPLDSDCMIGSAAEACNDYKYSGYEDWFLPDMSQLVSMAGIQSLSNVIVGRYWCSSIDVDGIAFTSEADNDNAIAIYINQHDLCKECIGSFGFPFSKCFEKLNREEMKLVRAVRRF